MHHRLINTLLICLLLFVTGALGLSYYTGYAGEQAVHQQLRLNQAQAARRGYELRLERYERGWFSSRAVLHLQPLGDSSDRAVRLHGELVVRHGPVLLLEDGWRVGLFALRAELGAGSHLGAISVDLPPEQLLDRLLVIGQFDGDYQVSWALPQIQLQQDDQVMSLRGAKLFWRGPYDKMAGQGELSFDQMKILWPGALSLTVTESDLELELAYLQDWLLEGRSRLQSQQGVWAGPGQLPLKFSQLDWRWSQTAEREQVSARYQLALSRLEAGPLVLEELAAHTHIRGLPVEVLRDWQQLAKERRASGQKLFGANEWLAVADEQLRAKLRADGIFEAQVGQGELFAQWQASFGGLPVDERINAAEWRDWATLWEAQLKLDVSEAALTGTPLYWLFAESVDRYLRPGVPSKRTQPLSTGKHRHFEAVWREGKLELNP